MFLADLFEIVQDAIHDDDVMLDQVRAIVKDQWGCSLEIIGAEIDENGVLTFLLDNGGL